MIAEVVTLECVTRLGLPPNRIMEAAKDKLEGVIVIGYDKEGQEYFASSYADTRQVLWLLERSKLKLLRMDEVS